MLNIDEIIESVAAVLSKLKSAGVHRSVLVGITGTTFYVEKQSFAVERTECADVKCLQPLLAIKLISVSLTPFLWITQVFPATTGNLAARHSGKPSFSRRALKPYARSAAIAS